MASLPCRVDAWAFERGLTADDPVQLAQTLSFYQGDFLHSEGDSLWLLPMRERLRRKYLQQLEKLTESLADNDQWQDVIVWYHRGLLVDNLHEACYQGLMRAHQKLGETGEATRVYRECQQKLQAELGVAPSLQTTALFESLSD
jgi:DNA-binding SARP family transcriptional activator